MSNFITEESITNLAGGEQIKYILSANSTPGSEKQLEVFITGSNGRILASAANNYDNRGEISTTINRQLDNKDRLIKQELEQLRSELATLRRILNDPNTPPDQVTSAEAAFNAGQEEQSILEAEESSILTVKTRFNNTFVPETNRLDSELTKAQQPPPATPTIDNTAAPANAAPAATGTNTLQGTASDDSGAQPTTPPSATAPAGTTTPVTGADPSINAPESPAAERETTPAANNTQGNPPYPNEEFLRLRESPEDRPGKRLKNPLTFMPSFNYQLSLYIITPDAYDAFLANGRRNINVFAERIGESVAATEANREGGAFLLAQSGGAGPDPRAPGVKYDYYIDNLSFTHYATAKETQSPTGNIEFSFQIIEPYGFSFISNLKKAQAQFDEFARKDVADQAARFTNTANSSIPTAKQFFILGIRFFGWNANGTPVMGDEIFEGSVLDPDNLGTGAIFETFYELVVYEIKYKIDGKATVYNIRANAAAPSLGSNIKKGFINSAIQAKGSTVRSYLSGPEGLITKLNQEQQNLKNNGSIDHPTTYKIRWLTEDAAVIAESSVVSETRTSRASQPSGQANNTEQANTAAEITATPNSNQVEISFAKDTPIVQAIDTLFGRSKYIEDMLTTNYTDSTEFDPETNTAESATPPKTPFKWFRVTPEISNVKWDSKIRDWAYDITYEIQTYLVPIVDSPFVANTTNYYGPHKRYDYWYTGENSEVISYSQTLDNQFYQEQPAGNPQSQQTPETGGNANRVAQAPNTTRSIDQNTSGATMSTAAAGAVRNALYDPGSYTKATVEILGDPDFLMQEATSGFKGINQAYSRFYGEGFTIKPTGGQVFFEIDFKEAVDYSASPVSELMEDGRGVSGVGGTLAINDSILFWDYPPEAKDVVKGISYSITKVKSSFRNGLFTQTLEAFINDFGRGALRNDAIREREDINRAATAAGGGTTSSRGNEGQEVSSAEDLVAQSEQARGTVPDAAAGTAPPATPQGTATPAPPPGS